MRGSRMIGLVAGFSQEFVKSLIGKNLLRPKRPVKMIAMSEAVSGAQVEAVAVSYPHQ